MPDTPQSSPTPPPFIRPPGSPVYGMKSRSLALPRRTTDASGRVATPGSAELRDATRLEIRQKIEQVIALICQEEGYSTRTPFADAQNRDLARSLQDLEVKLAERERVVEERELKMSERERDLAEGEALLKHHEALLAASRRTPAARAGLSEEERFALVNLKAELDRQETQLRETRETLRLREEFIQESEARLFEKVQQQQEKETELEQREEELRQRIDDAAAQSNTPPPPKPAFDEFNE